jgi:hypothetical protein
MTTWNDDVPAGARAGLSAAPAGYHGEEFRRKVKAALAGQRAASRRRTGRTGRGGYRAGMARKPPPEPDGDDAA